MGEVDENNEAIGRGIYISEYGHMSCGRFSAIGTTWDVGNFIDILSDSEFWVGTAYLHANGEIYSRYTSYYPDGTIE